MDAPLTCLQQAGAPKDGINRDALNKSPGREYVLYLSLETIAFRVISGLLRF